MTVRIDTRKYEASHGRKPRQSREFKTSLWAFQIDLNPTAVWINRSYRDAVKHAKALADFSITVLP